MSIGARPQGQAARGPLGLYPALLDPHLGWLNHCPNEATARVPAWQGHPARSVT